MASAVAIDPVVHNLLHYLLNDNEYASLHRKLPFQIQKRVVLPQRYEDSVRNKDDYHPAALRAAFRVFAATGSGLKLWDVVQDGLLSRGKPKPYVLYCDPYILDSKLFNRPRTKVSLFKSSNFRLALSLSTILYLHRIFHRFFLRLRLRLLSEKAKSLRLRHPELSRLLTSRLTLAFGTSLAGFGLGIYPSSQLRLTIAIYVAARSLEFLYNALSKGGWFSKQPKWMGAWLFFPLSCGQLLHAFVFDRDCFPKVERPKISCRFYGRLF